MKRHSVRRALKQANLAEAESRKLKEHIRQENEIADQMEAALRELPRSAAKRVLVLGQPNPRDNGVYDMLEVSPTERRLVRAEAADELVELKELDDFVT